MRSIKLENKLYIKAKPRGIIIIKIMGEVTV